MLVPRGLRVDGYGGDPIDSDGVLSLIVARFRPESKRCDTDWDGNGGRASGVLVTF